MPIDPARTGQTRYRVGFDWGLHGLRALAPARSVMIVVDVLSFCTAVEVALNTGARVLPVPWRDVRAQDAADRAGAVLAAGRSTTEWSLSPSSLRDLGPDTLLALPSPNGATLCAEAAATGAGIVFSGCLRNARAVAEAARDAADGGSIGVVAAGERWELAGQPLRPAVEDLLGAGAVIDALGGSNSPEAEVAATTFRGCRERIDELLIECVSGRELTALGYAHDVRLAAEVNVSTGAPMLRHGVLEAR